MTHVSLMENEKASTGREGGKAGQANGFFGGSKERSSLDAGEGFQRFSLKIVEK